MTRTVSGRQPNFRQRSGAKDYYYLSIWASFNRPVASDQQEVIRSKSQHHTGRATPHHTTLPSVQPTLAAGGAIAVALLGHKFQRLIKTDKLESHRESRVIKFNQSWKPFDSLLESVKRSWSPSLPLLLDGWC